METIVIECQKLQSKLAPAGETIRHFIAAYPGGQVQLSPLLEELLSLPNVVVKLEQNASGCEADDDLVSKISRIPHICVDNITQIESLLRISSRLYPHEMESLSEQAAVMGSLLATERRALNLAVNALDLVKGLQRAERNGESPPYATNPILQDISSIQTLLGQETSSESITRLLRELEIQDRESAGFQQLHTTTISGFLNTLKSFVEQQSGGMSTLQVARRSIAGSAISNMSPPPELDLSYLAPTLLEPPPSNVNFKHIGKIVMNLEKEPLDIKFMPGNPVTFATASFHRDVVLFNATTADRRKEIKVKGVHMIFSPMGDLMAITVEHMDELPHKQKPIPITHDFVRFKKPALYVLDTPRGTGMTSRRFFLQWHGIRAFSFNPEGSLLAIKGVRHRVELISSAKGLGYGVVRSHTDEVTHAEFTADGERLATMSKDGTMRVTNIRTLHSVARLEMDSWRNPLQLAVSPSGVVASIWGRTVTIWDYQTGAMNSYNFETARGSEGWPLAISPDLRWVASRTDEGADVTALATGKVVYSARLETGFVTSAAFSNDSKYLVFGRCTNGHHGRADSGILNMWEIVV
ncbi:Vegetative incompatibility protein HET-E-1 [Colletotrichum fructicola]|nr:Vegetative incompatibility protein HET-E-1 [Colletotrichum fructicola]KAF4940531.1 Vegetative incompatibility protein HET-E-1 [Colletotrichum fructicola]